MNDKENEKRHYEKTKPNLISQKIYIIGEKEFSTLTKEGEDFLKNEHEEKE